MKICKIGFISALGIGIYIFLVALLTQNADRIFGKMGGVMGFTAFVTLVTFSVAVVGSLILGKPIMLYLDGKKKEAIKTFFAILGWLFVFLVLVFAWVWIKK